MHALWIFAVTCKGAIQKGGECDRNNRSQTTDYLENPQYRHVCRRGGTLELRLADGSSLPVVSFSLDSCDSRVVRHLFHLSSSLVEALFLAIVVQSLA